VTACDRSTRRPTDGVSEREGKRGVTDPKDRQEFIPSLMRTKELSQERAGRKTGHLLRVTKEAVTKRSKTCNRMALDMLITKPRKDFFSTGVRVHLEAAPGSGALN
jgi:hypothetical protein